MSAGFFSSSYVGPTMRRCTRVTAMLALSVGGVTGELNGQMLRSPTFAFEPGAVTVNAISAPLPTGSSTGLNLRFLATFSTPIPWLTVEVGTSFAPLGLSNGQRALNEPTFFYGPIVMLFPRDRTRNWLELSLPILGAYRLDENGEADRLYVNDLVIQGVAAVPIGQKLMGDMGPFWSRLTLYGIVEQNLTPSRNFTTREIDRFNPTFLYGVSIPFRGSSRDTP
jgi:hypothetical protein